MKYVAIFFDLAAALGRFATKATLLGSPRHFGRRSSSEVQFKHPGTAGFFFLAASSLHSGDWLQAMPIVMWVEA